MLDFCLRTAPGQTAPGNLLLEEEAEEVIGGLNENYKNRILWAAMEDATGSKELVEAIAKDILQHYVSRASSLAGKAMFVCMSRRNCLKLYDSLTAQEGCLAWHLPVPLRISLPLVPFEFINWFDAEATARATINQVQYHRHFIPKVFSMSLFPKDLLLVTIPNNDKFIS